MMRKLFWIAFIVGGYIWLVTSGHDGFVIEKGKSLYQSFVTWLDDTHIEFHFKKEKARKHSRRWD